MLNTEKEFDFRRKQIKEEKKSSSKGKIGLLFAGALLMWNAVSSYQVEGYTLNMNERNSAIKNHYQKIINDLNDKKYNFSEFNSVKESGNIIKDLAAIANFGSYLSFLYILRI